MERQRPNEAPAPGSYYGNMGVDILWTGDLAVTEDMVLPPVRPDDETGSFDVEELEPHRRGFERYDFGANFVRAALLKENGKTGATGRVTNASVTGMWVETNAPLPFRTDVDVDWCVMGSYSMRFSGRVVRTTDSGMAVVLEVDDSSWRFRSSFVDLARTPSEEPPSVVVKPRKGPAPPRAKDHDLAALASAWKLVEKDLFADEVHQRFINTCLSAQRLEYALERYRELKLHNPTSELATRYLKQIGTILTFYTLNQKPTDDGVPRWKKIAMVAALLAIGAVGALTFAERLAASRLQARSLATQQLTPPPGASR